MPRSITFPIAQSRCSLLRLAAFVALLVAPVLEAATVQFQLRGTAGEGLLPGNVVPVTSSAGSGGEIGEGITFNDATNELEIRVGWGSGQGFTNLQGAPIAVHLHGPSNIDFNLTVNTSDNDDLPLTMAGTAASGTITGTLTLTPTQVTELFNGRYYLCIHTTSFPFIELRGTLAPETVVTNTDDDGPGSLRLAIRTAAALPGADTVTFAPTLSGLSIALSTGTDGTALAINDAGGGLTIDASNLPGGITIHDGGASHRLFSLEGTSACTLRGVSLTSSGGNATGAGGAIVVGPNASLTLERCTLSGNQGAGNPLNGGAIANAGTATLTYCTLANNSATGGQGGAIYNTGTLTLRHCTLAGNSASEGGAIYNSGTANLSYSLIAGNNATTGPDVSNHATVTHHQISFLGNLSGSGLSSGTTLLTGNAQLGPAGLANNGGQNLTVALQFNSPAVDAATGSTSTFDQRGFFTSGVPDLGAFEIQAQEIAVENSAGNELNFGSASATFGPVEMGASADLVFTIRNKGAGTLTLPGATPVTISGPDAARFSVVAQPSSPVAPDGPTTFTVRFSPTGVGSKTATVSINHNHSAKNPFAITLAGQGVDTITVPPTIVSPSIGTRLVSTLDVTFTLPEAAATNGVSLVLENAETSIPIPLPPGIETVGSHSVSVEVLEEPRGTYEVTLSYQDAAGHAAASTTVTPIFLRPSTPESVALAAKGTEAPGRGTNGLPGDAVLATFNLPAIDDGGHIAYVAKWTSNNGKVKGTGLFLDDLCLGIIGGDASAVGGAGAKWKTFGDPVIGGGSVGCIATLSGVKSTAASVVVSNLGTDNLLKIAQMGDSGTADGAKFKAFKNVMMMDGQIAFLAQLATGTGTTPKTSSANDLGIWLTGHSIEGASTQSLVLRKGAVSGGLTIKTLTVFLPGNISPGSGRGYVIQPNDSGDPQVGALAFFTDKVKKQGLIFQDVDESDFTAISLANDPATGLQGGGSFASYGPLARSGDEETVFLGKLNVGPGVTSATASGIFAGPNENGKFVSIARLGDNAAQGAKFSAFKDPVLSSDGTLAFLATLKGGTVKSLGAQTLWWQPAGEPLSLLAQGGPNAGGAPSDLPTGAQWKSFTTLAIAGGGRGPIFSGALVTGQGGVKSTDATGVWAVDFTGKIRTLFRLGDVIGGKTVKAFTLLKATVGNTGVTRSHNDNAQVIWLATFKEDGSQAIVVSEVP